MNVLEARAQPASVEDILLWREQYRQEMSCQIVHDSLHSRAGWTQPYVLEVDGATAGYASVLVGGPWRDTPTAFEFWVAAEHRARVFDLFAASLETSGAIAIRAQTNDALLTVMLHAWARDVASESIVFHDELTTTHQSPGALFRAATPDDAERIFPHQHEPLGDWVLEVDGVIAATGGILFHYNPPYGDLYMEVAEPFRRRGLATYLVQELKRVCREMGRVPCARCNPANVASRQTLQKAGFVPCAHILTGSINLPPG